MARTYAAGIILPVGLVGRQTGTPAADSTIWAIRNTGTILMALRRLRLRATFDGTAAATTALYRFCRFTTATPTGGTDVVAVKKDSGITLPTYDAREALAGLTTTSCVFDAGFALFGNQRQVSAGETYDLTFNNSPRDEFLLKPGEGLAIRLSAAAVAGDCLAGSIEIDHM